MDLRFTVVAASAAPAIDRYDLNRDGQVDEQNLTLLQQTISVPFTFELSDLDDDGAVDAHDTAHRVENGLHSWMGDANLEGQFDADDIPILKDVGFGKRATWQTGDFDSNGMFTTDDLVLAFQYGGYGQGRRSTWTLTESDLAAAVDLILADPRAKRLAGRAE